MLYTFGCNSVKECGKNGERFNTPGKVDIFTRDHVTGFDIFAGYKHAACLTSSFLRHHIDEASVYTWGEASGGKLGHSESSLSALPRIVESLSGLEVTAMSLGPEYTVVATGPYSQAIRSESTILE